MLLLVAVAGALSTSQLSLARSAHAAGSDTIRVGLIGCGGRGTSAVQQAMGTKSGNVELVALADAYENRLDKTLDTCARSAKLRKRVKVTDDNKFVGLDAYLGVLDSAADVVLMATPPGFRPLHFSAAVEAGKHVFMEKPVAVDAPGVRQILEAGERAKQKGLLVQVGLQRRHVPNYINTIKKLKDGIIGDLIYSRVYWNSSGVWINPRQPGQSELDYQLRNWYYFNWLCGDHIVEQHIHNLDVINWLMDDYPETAQGQGGREVRIGPDTGQIFDHHSVEYTYRNGHKMFSQCRHIKNCGRQVGEYVHGTKGYADIGRAEIFDNKGNRIFKGKEKVNGHNQEQVNLFASLQAGELPNEAEYGAKSTMTAIFGRMATYTGQHITWDQAIESKISLANMEAITNFDAPAPIQPDKDGNYKVPVPGVNLSEILDWEPYTKS